MNSEEDAAVLEAMQRRQAREVERTALERKQHRTRLLWKSLVPAGVIFPFMLVPYLGWLVAVCIVIPFFALPWIINCTVKLVPCVTWAITRLERIAVGIALFSLLLMLNAAVLCVFSLLVLSLISLTKLLR